MLLKRYSVELYSNPKLERLPGWEVWPLWAREGHF